MTENVKTRNKIMELPEVVSFNNLIERSTLKPIEKELMCMHYLQDKDFCYISDILGYSESWMKRVHLKALKKLSKLL